MVERMKWMHSSTVDAISVIREMSKEELDQAEEIENNGFSRKTVLKAIEVRRRKLEREKGKEKNPEIEVGDKIICYLNHPLMPKELVTVFVKNIRHGKYVVLYGGEHIEVPLESIGWVYKTNGSFEINGKNVVGGEIGV